MREITHRAPLHLWHVLQSALSHASHLRLLTTPGADKPHSFTHVQLKPSAADWESINSVLCVPATNAILLLSSS